MKLSNVILASLLLASLSGNSQDEKPIGCGKKPVKEVCPEKNISGKTPDKENVAKKDSLQAEPVKRNTDKCMKCGRG